MEQMTNRTN